MAQFTGTIDQTIDMLHKGLQQQLQEAIYYRLINEAQIIIKECARIEAEKCIKNITAWRHMDRNTIELNIYFGDKKVD